VEAVIAAGLVFARTIQLKVNADIVRQQPKSGRGAIAHSLCDHNFYIDYTAHAVQLATLTKELLH
jgi:hypothetical protein